MSFRPSPFTSPIAATRTRWVFERVVNFWKRQPSVHASETGVYVAASTDKKPAKSETRSATMVPPCEVSPSVRRVRHPASAPLWTLIMGSPGAASQATRLRKMRKNPARRAIIARMATLKELISCTSDYDPDALPVAKANEVIRSFVNPVSGVEKLRVRAALGRVLAKDLVSPINVPSHDNSAMDGYAVRNDDLGAGEPVVLTEIGTAYAGRQFAGEVKRGECVRVMPGAVMPSNTATVVIQEAVTANGKRITIPPGQEPGQNRRLAGEDLQKGRPALHAGRMLRPADIGLIASLGVGEVSVRRK